MTPEEAPVGTVVVLGNPKNGQTATKQLDGQWRYNQESFVDGFSVAFHRLVDYDDIHKAATAVFIPGREPAEVTFND